VHCNQTFDHLTLSFSDRCHIRWVIASRTTKSGCVVNEVGDLCAPDLVLAGKAIHIRARPADPTPFDHNRFLSRLCQMPCEVFSAFPTTNDDVLVILSGHLGVRSKAEMAQELGYIHQRLC
jgi:hypothetical protein